MAQKNIGIKSEIETTIQARLYSINPNLECVLYLNLRVCFNSRLRAAGGNQKQKPNNHLSAEDAQAAAAAQEIWEKFDAKGKCHFFVSLSPISQCAFCLIK